MMSADEDVTARNRHVLRQFAFHREVALVSVGVFKVLLHVQRERQHRTKAGECLIVESLATKLILRAGGNTRRHNARWAERISARRRADGSLKHLRGVQ